MKKENGITLIALIVTIIILLILAGVTIATLTGENGILSKASRASEETKIATAEEKIKLAIGEYEVNQRLVTLYSCLEKIEGLESITPDNANQIPPCHVIVDGYEFEITGEREVKYIQKMGGISPEIEKFEKSNSTETKVTLKIKASTKDSQGLEKLIIKNGDAIIEQKDISGNQIEESIDVTSNGDYTITIIGKNGKRVTSEIIDVTEINTINGKITAGTVIDGNVALVTVGETGASSISKVEVYSKGNIVASKEFTDKNIEYETEVKSLVFYEDTTCYAILTDSSGKTFKTNEVHVKNTDAIANETDLRSFASVVNNGTSFENAKEIKQIKDITLTQTHTTIGTESKPFKGTYNGKKIDGIQINNSEKDQGLFGYIENATIKNVVLGNGSIQGNYNVGGICGNSNNSTINNCTNENTTVVAKSYITKTYTWENEEKHPFSNVGGLVGYGYNCNIESCNNNSAINGYYSAIAGIVGFNDGNKERKISNCNNEATFSITFQDDAAYGVAGIVGENYKQGIVENCNNTGNIICSQGSGNVGGIVGDSIGIIQNCNNKGNIEAKAIVGGITGSSITSSKVENCINEGTIKATGSLIIGAQVYGKTHTWNSSLIGGIVGYNIGNIVSCKNKGNIQSANEEVGGIAGYSLKNSSIKKCVNYQNIETSQVIVVGGIVGYTNQCTIEECFNVGNITSKEYAGGIAGETTYTTIKNCYNIGCITASDRVGGIVGEIAPYELSHGYEYMYNCYNIGNVVGTSNIDPFAGKTNYLTWDYLYTTKSLYDVIGGGSWQNNAGNQNWEAISGTDEQIKSKMLTNLLKENGAGKWTRDTTKQKNNGYPYLIDNPV